MGASMTGMYVVGNAKNATAESDACVCAHITFGLRGVMMAGISESDKELYTLMGACAATFFGGGHQRQTHETRPAPAHTHLSSYVHKRAHRCGKMETHMRVGHGFLSRTH